MRLQAVMGMADFPQPWFRRQRRLFAPERAAREEEWQNYEAFSRTHYALWCWHPFFKVVSVSPPLSPSFNPQHATFPLLARHVNDSWSLSTYYVDLSCTPGTRKQFHTEYYPKPPRTVQSLKLLGLWLLGWPMKPTFSAYLSGARCRKHRRVATVHP